MYEHLQESTFFNFDIFVNKMKISHSTDYKFHKAKLLEDKFN